MKKVVYAGRDDLHTAYRQMKVQGWSSGKSVLVRQAKICDKCYKLSPVDFQKSTESLKQAVRNEISQAENILDKLNEYLEILTDYHESKGTINDVDSFKDKLKNFEWKQGEN